MCGVALTGHGGMDKLVWRDDLPVPQLSRGEVLIKVGACGLNNTDVNTRIGWYSKSIKTETQDQISNESVDDDATWGGKPLSFPRIQGADIVGEVYEARIAKPARLLGKRVMVDPWLRDDRDQTDFSTVGYLGSEIDGGFAEYVKVPANAVHVVSSDLSDAELATFATSGMTAENMLERAMVSDNDTVLITGASGGVGSALVQLCNRRGAKTIALTSREKIPHVESINPTFLALSDGKDLGKFVQEATNGKGATVVADIVGGPRCPPLLDMLTHGGRYVCSGAIAGPIISLDLRTLYLKDLTMVGATVVPRGLFGRLVGYIERNEIKPLLAATYPLSQFHEAQRHFLTKSHVGNIVVEP